jgi:colanic acid biosynthesis glycosyl transferase WcaI
LKAQGHEVEVLTGFPNYPSGQLYEGYRLKFYQREIINGIKIFRVPLYPSHDNSFLRRAINYISFAISASLIGGFVTSRPDVIYAYHAPATIGLPAILLSWLKKAPFVYDINDLWPDSLLSTGMMHEGIGMQILDWWCSFVYEQAAKVTVGTPGYKERLISKGVLSEKIKMIYNWSDDDKIHFNKRNENIAVSLGMAGRFNVVFAGNMGKAQALEAVLSAAGIIDGVKPEVQFVFIGGGIEMDRLRMIAEEKHSKNVLFFPRVPYNEIGAILSLADVLLVHLKDDPLFQITIPSKTQSYLAAGKPILMAVRGDSADLVTKSQAGFVCTPEDSEDIAEKVINFFELSSNDLEKLGQNGRQYYEKELSMSIGTKHFIDIFNTVIKKGN